MNLVEKLAEQTAGNMSASGTSQALDAGTFMAIAEIIWQLIEALKACQQTPEQASVTANRPGFFERVVVRQTVRRNLGIRAFREKGEEIVDALLKTGKSVSVTEMEQLLNSL